MIASASARVLPTESRDKVRERLASLFPDAELSFQGGEWRAEKAGLGHFTSLVSRQKISGAIQRELEKSFDGKKAHLDLNKQCMGKVNICIGHELGPITLCVECTESELIKIAWGDANDGD